MSKLDLVKIVMLKGEKGDSGDAGDYSTLAHRPSINGVILDGNKTGDDLNLVEQGQTYNRSEVYNKTETYSKDEVYNKTETYNKSEVYAKGDSLPDYEGYQSRWQMVNVPSKSSAQHIEIIPEENSYLLVNGAGIIIAIWYKNENGVDWWYAIGHNNTEHDDSEYSPLYPIKAGTRVRLSIPSNRTASYALIPTIGV